MFGRHAYGRDVSSVVGFDESDYKTGHDSAGGNGAKRN
jgi:hypothetical protein